MTKINVKVGYTVDKNDLNELKRQLQEVRLSAAQAKLTGTLTEDLKEAKEAAFQLEDILDRSWNNKLNQLDLSKVNTGIKNTYGSVENLQKALSKSGNVGATAYNNFALSVLNTNVQLKQANETLNKMAITFKNTVRFGISSSVFNNLTGSIEKAYNYTKQLDTSLNDIRIVTGKSADEMDKFAVRANKVAKDLGKSTKDFTEASLIYYQQGLGNEEAQARAEVTLKTANVTGQNSQEVSELLTSVWNGYKVTADEAELYVDKLAAVASSTASNLEELSTGMSKVASAANLMGVDIDQLNAQLATIVSVTRQAPESVGTALKTIYARMGDIEAGLDNEVTLGDYTSQMAEMGINVLDTNGKLRDMGDVIEEIGSKWASMSREQQIALSQVMAGSRQYNNLLSLFDNWDMYTEALETSANAAGTLQQQQDTYMESTKAHLQELSTEAERTYDILFNQDTVNGFADALTGTLSIFNNFLEGLGGGTKDFIFFGSTIANIFNKQIGGSIEKQIENIETMKANLGRLDVQQQVINLHALRGDGVTNDKALEKEAQYAEKTLQLQQYLTEEQNKQFTEEQAQIGVLEQRIQGILQYKNIAEKYIQNVKETGKVSIDDFDAELEKQKQLRREETARYRDLRKGIEEYSQGVEYSFETEEKRREISQSLIDIMGDMTYKTEEQSKAIEIMSQVQAGEKLSTEDINFLLEIQRRVRADINTKVQALQTGMQGIADKESGVLADLQQEQSLREKNLQTMQQQAERQAKISQTIQGVTSLVSLVTSLTGIVQTLNSEDLTAGEKFSQVLTVAVGSLPLIVLNFKAIASLLPGILSVLKVVAGGGIATAIVAGVGLITAGIVAVVKASQAEQKEIDAMRNSAKELSEQATETKTTLDKLKTSLNGYSEAIDTLKSCTQGTDDWNTALESVNETILEILNKYPELAKIEGIVSRDSSTGALSLNEDLLNAYQKELQKRYITQKAGSIAISAQANKAQSEKDFNDILTSINSRFKGMQNYYSGGVGGEGYKPLPNGNTNFLTSEQLSELTSIANVSNLYTQKVQEYIDKMVDAGELTEQNATKWASTMETFREQIVATGNAAEKASISLDNATTIIGSTALGENATNVQQQMFGKIYTDTYSQERDKASNLFKKKSNYNTILDYYNAAVGGNYTKAQDHKVFKGWDGSKGVYAYNPTTGEDEKLNKETIIDAIASYNAAMNAENAKTYDEAAELLKKVAEAGSIDEDVADQVLSKTFNVNELTENEYNQIIANKEKIEQELTDDNLQKIGVENAQDFITNFENELSKWDPETAAENAKKKLESSLESAGKIAEKSFNLDADEFKEYGEYLSEIADKSKELDDSLKENGDAVAVVTQSILRMNKGVESLSDGWKDWNSVLKKSSKESQEYWEALDKTQDALADLLDASDDVKKYFTDDFIKENADEIAKAAKGDEKAIDSLRRAALKQIVLNIELNDNSKLTNEELWKSVQGLQDKIKELNLNVEVGTTIDDQSFVDACNNMIEQASLTKEQANAIFEQMGFNANFETDSQPTKYVTPIYTTYTRSIGTKEYNGNTYDTVETFTEQTGEKELTGEYSTFGMAVTPKGETAQAPKITGVVKKAGGKSNNYSSANKGGKKLGGSGGSSKKADKMDPIKKDNDRYHDVDITLKQISTDLDKLNKQKEKLFGNDLIANLNKQLKLLNKQIDTNNEKIKIARQEAKELRDELANKGAIFNEDGTIANYTEIYVSQWKYVNNLISKYNTMGASAQEKFKDTVENAKDNFNKFVENLSRYDEVITDLIPGLESDIQDAVDEQIDIQIEKFDMEIELRLNLAEAERDWNEFKKKIIDEIDDDDILGNAMAKLVDFSSYYKEDNTGVVQALRKQIDNTLKELNQMDTTGWSSVYGDNRTSALEDLKNYYDELSSNLMDVLELQKEIHESYVDMMDEAQDKFDEQIKSYELISDLIEHDMNVISMVYGDQSYEQLSKYYDKQQENYNKQLDFQRQQMDFWRQQLDTLEEGSDEWDAAKGKWEDAVSNWNSLIENSIENLQNKYLNSINLIFQNLNNKVTNNMGLDYVEEEWNLINDNADQYLDKINSLYEIQKLENKYTDALDQTDNVAAQRQLKKLMEEELADLRERDKLTQYDVDRANKKYEIALKQIALQEAQQNKTKMRLRRDSQGNYRYEYTADNDQVSSIQDELGDLYNSLYNFDKSKYQENLNQLYSVWVDFQNKMAEAAQINDPTKRAEKEALLQEQYEKLINGLTQQNATIRQNLHESAFDDLSRLYNIDVSNFQNMTDEEKEALMNDLIPYWNSGVQKMADSFAGEGGFLGVCKDAFEQLHQATKDYEDGLGELEETGKLSFDSISQGIDNNINRTQELITDNKELINSYEQELTAIQNVIKQLDDLVNKYKEAKDAAVAATKAAYDYWSNQQRKAANAANQESQNSNANNSNLFQATSKADNKNNNSSNSGGDGNLVIGDSATYSGKYYYDSYGTTPSGSKYSGIANGIIVDRITNNPYGIHIRSADGKYLDLGWIKKSQLSGYDTGGYTGEWAGKEGRLALLHQKELVLKEEDTQNILNAVNAIRNITNAIGSNLLSKLASVTAGKLDYDTDKGTLEQNVHIDAQFPNVKDSREIENALNNLVNMASMRINKR